jgi:hypothetical protein
VGVATNRELRQEYRYSEQQDTSDINYQKGSSAILARNVGETPYISQAYGTAGSHQHGTQSATQCCSIFLNHISQLNLTFSRFKF